MPPLSAQEEIDLGRNVQGGCMESRAKMLLSNTRLVVSIAKEMYRGPGTRCELYDLIMEGVVGLITAVDRFDPERNVRFSSYGSYWIKQAIRQHMGNNNGPVRTPIHVQQLATRLYRVADQLMQEKGGSITPDEVAAELGMTAEEALLAMCWSPSELPLDAEIEEGIPLKELIPEEIETLSYEIDREFVVEKVSELEGREREIMFRRFGLDGPVEGLAEIGKTMGITGERVRQMQQKVIDRLRKACTK